MRSVLACLGCAAFTACVVSVDAAVPASQATFDPWLVGSWVELGDSDRATISRGDGNSYAIEYIERSGKHGRFEATLGHLGRRLVLDIRAADKPPLKDMSEAGTLIRGHLLLLLDVAADSVVVRGVQPDSVRAALKSGALQLAYLLEDDQVVLAAPTAALRRGLAAYFEHTGVLDDPATWRRTRGP